MTATPVPSVASVFDRSPRDQHMERDPVMSSGKLLVECPRTYRQHFVCLWQTFIRENFRSPAHAADVFRVDASTAANWWDGLNAPQGWVVGRAIADPQYSEQAIRFLREAS